MLGGFKLRCAEDQEHRSGEQGQPPAVTVRQPEPVVAQVLVIDKLDEQDGDHHDEHEAGEVTQPLLVPRDAREDVGTCRRIAPRPTQPLQSQVSRSSLPCDPHNMMSTNALPRIIPMGS